MHVPSDKKRIALARLPSLIRDAARDFHRLTGHTVVTTLGSPLPAGRSGRLPSPPVHPVCAKLLREKLPDAPCEAEWREHLRRAVDAGDCRIHTCPLGLRCAGIPIILGDELFGLVKFVAGPELSPNRFRSLVRLLKALIAQPCQDLYILLLREEIEGLHLAVDRLRRVRASSPRARGGADLPANPAPTHDETPTVRALIRQVLDYLDAHHADITLSLGQIAGAVGKNEKYLTHLFVQQVGERMRTYITRLRVRRACELLLGTTLTVEEIARGSGFANASQFRRCFRRMIGVTASEYRLIFTTGA